MLMMRAVGTLCLGLFLALASQVAAASDGLVVHAAEFGVGKFHRYDDQVHPYGNSAWSPYILNASTPTDKVVTLRNADGSYTIFFSTLVELVESVAKLSADQGAKVSVLNLHGHGLPGGMWFPKDQRALEGWGCGSWRQAANGSDEDNYDQYYSSLSVNDIMSIRAMSENPAIHSPCTTGLPEWHDVVQSRPAFRQALASDLQVHFLSCVVGLGSVGDSFTKGLAALLLTSGGGGRIEASVNFGLGDWSMPEGMGFWDYQNDEQIRRDNQTYSTTKRDSDIAQKGTIRVSDANGASLLLTDRDFMKLNFETTALPTSLVFRSGVRSSAAPLMTPAKVRVPGTKVYLDLQAR